MHVEDVNGYMLGSDWLVEISNSVRTIQLGILDTWDKNGYRWFEKEGIKKRILPSMVSNTKGKMTIILEVNC